MRRRLSELGSSLFARRYLLSPAVNSQRFSVEGLREGIGDSLALLGTPAGALIKPVLLRDPTGESLRLLESLGSGGGTGPRSEAGVWVSRDAPRAVLIATTRGDGANLDAQESAMRLVRQHFAPHAAQRLDVVAHRTWDVRRHVARDHQERSRTPRRGRERSHGAAAVGCARFVAWGGDRAAAGGRAACSPELPR